jgi:hypothetical protein
MLPTHEMVGLPFKPGIRSKAFLDICCQVGAQALKSLVLLTLPFKKGTFHPKICKKLFKGAAETKLGNGPAVRMNVGASPLRLTQLIANRSPISTP